VSDEYKDMGPGELLTRLEDWMRVATDRGTRITELEVEQERLQAVVDGYVDDLSHIAFAVAGDRTGSMHHDDILDLVRRVVTDRDRLSAEVTALSIASMSSEGEYHEAVAQRDQARDELATWRTQAIEWQQRATAFGEQVALANNAADTAAEAVGSMAEKLSAMLAENNRLRAVVERAHDRVGVDEHVLRTLATDDLIALVGVLRQDYRDVVVERDRLRAAATHLVSGIEFDLPDDRSQIVLIGELRALRDALDGTAEATDE
jgi:chromosome segregation ATPase